ncbi:MAG TPA: YdcF family protein [Alphaproteobacteria bacterium]|nr:YdcF family protein [Alphaproteobacteria bacterium]
MSGDPPRAFSTRRRKPKLWAGLIFIAIAAWLAGLIWFAQSIPRTPDTSTTTTDAAVVLTGGTGRLSVGVRLLARGRARKLFVSGVYRGVDVARILRLVRQQGRELECCMALGHAADNTQGNARETAEWIRAEGFKSLRLVTANYHMCRSLLEFRRMMPDVTIIPHPVFPGGFKADQWWRHPGSLRLVVSEYVKYLIAQVRFW